MDDQWVLSQRSAKNAVDVREPYAFLVENERSASGKVEPVATLFLTNKECPFRCLMCDLWKNTTDERTPVGAIPHQIALALKRLPPARHIKLYNSGNFFDTKAIPPADYAEIAALLDPFETVIVECHPKLINKRCLEFQAMLKGQLEIAIGLETAHPDILLKLNKGMDLEDFQSAVAFLNRHQINTRAFTLLKPPFLSEQDGIYWAKKTLDFAFDCGVATCVIIPTRAGNGAMDWLEANGAFSRPSIISLEKVLAYGILLQTGHVYADVWDLEYFSTCPTCIEQRRQRLTTMNHLQKILPEINCSCS